LLRHYVYRQRSGWSLVAVER